MKLKPILCFVSVAFTSWAGSAFAALTATESAKVDAYLNDFQKGVVVQAVKSGQSGELVSCVDINKQLSSNNPVMKGHVAQTEPSAALKAMLGGKITTKPLWPTECPAGSVEMIPPSREKLERAGSLEKFQGVGVKKNIFQENPSFSAIGHEYAVAGQYQSGPFFGVQSTFNIWQPSVPVDAIFSLSQLWLTGGTGSGTQTVETGWVVYPSQYGDNLPHVFIFATSDNYGQLGYPNCWDNKCGNYTQVTSNILIGGALPYSTTNGAQIEGTLAYVRDPATANWWLFYVDASGNYYPSGYYPASFFHNGQLTQSGANISFGGEVAAPPNTSPHPQVTMGSGTKPRFGGYGQVAYQRNLKWMDANINVLDVISNGSAVTNSFCYFEVDGGSSNLNMPLWGAQPNWGTSMFFGGAGGKDPSCN